MEGNRIMERVEILSSRVVPLPLNDIDTDQIIPASFLTGTTSGGLGRHLFADLRFDKSGSPVASFPLNRPEHEGARILVTGENFGCGSSREHAAWALKDFGLRAVISTSFADIFYTNALKNGLLPVVVSSEARDALFAFAEASPAEEITIDLSHQEIRWPGGSFAFSIDGFAKTCLLNGVDEMGYIMRFSDAIGRYEIELKEGGRQ
jgi:3-isopropylmalate/(R)-2-methylmalate dehydratase small subunit